MVDIGRVGGPGGDAPLQENGIKKAGEREWLIGNVIAWPIALVVVAVLRESTHRDWIGAAVAGGLIIGAGQWFGLRRHAALSWKWFLVFGVFWATGIYYSILNASLFGIPDPIILSTVGGTLSGVVQWRVLRATTRSTWTWIPTNVVTATAGCWAGAYSGFEAYGWISETACYGIGGLVVGLLIGLGSGLVLAPIKNDSPRMS